MNIVQAFENHSIRFVEHPEKGYEFGIVADDLASVLGASSGKDIARSVEEEWKGLHNVPTPGGTQSMAVIWEPGLRQLPTKSRKPKAKEVAIALGLTDILAPSKEAETIGIIKNAFAHISSVEQFFVLGFRIDLYFPEHRLAIECDEKHHFSPDQEQRDIARQDIITKALGCTWIRYCPDETGFCVGKVINQIMQAIQG